MGRSRAIATEAKASLAAIAGASAAQLAALDRATLGRHTRAIVRWLAVRHPGRIVEVRVPPFVAVQVGFGDSASAHTRGTPPNVVEMGPAALLGLANGTLVWADAHRQGLISASGTRSDLSLWFPLVSGNDWTSCSGWLW